MYGNKKLSLFLTCTHYTNTSVLNMMSRTVVRCFIIINFLSSISATCTIQRDSRIRKQVAQRHTAAAVLETKRLAVGMWLPRVRFSLPTADYVTVTFVNLVSISVVSLILPQSYVLSSESNNDIVAMYE